MTAFIALLRAVNVGGTGKLAMADLKALCEAVGFAKVRTYIASGNVVFISEWPEARVKAALESKLAAHIGKPVAVILRTAAEMAAVLTENPFSDRAPNRTVAIFLDDPPPADALHAMSGQHGEEVSVGRREIWVHYGSGMADSRLKIAAASKGTGRNVNTVVKLAQMAAKL